MYLATTAQVQEALADLEAMPLLAVDTETSGLDPLTSELLLFQIGDLEKQFVIDARKASLEPLRPILEGKKPKVVHNAKFDYKMVAAQAGMYMENLVDTMLVEQVLLNGREADGGFGLAAVYRRYTGRQISKEEQESFVGHQGDFSTDQLDYARRDILYVLEALFAQMPAVRRARLDHTVRLECLAVNAIADIELNGFLLDQQRWRGLVERAAAAAEDHRRRLDQKFTPYLEERGELVLFGVPRSINYDSDQQVKEALQGLGYQIESTGRDVIERLDSPIAKLLLEYRAHQKIVSAYGDAFLQHVHPKTGRIHCDFRQLGAESGRLSSTNPNLQNIPAESEFRSCFIAPQGWRLITADYDGCELRILAEMSRDPEFLRAFRNKEDVHSLVASMMFGEPISRSQNQHLRQAAKAINFGLAYGMSPKGLAAQMGCGEEEARDMLNRYFAAFPTIRDFLENSARVALSRGYSTTIGGRRRYFDVASADRDRALRGAIERKGKNSPIQGTNADMIKLALYDLRRIFRERGLPAKLVNTVHDEIVVEAEADSAEEIRQVVEDTMRRAGQRYLKTVPVEVESRVSDCWSK
jgi:DNA polymerase I-like protein with 3'-5' exonuclease and polymerase domains